MAGTQGTGAIPIRATPLSPLKACSTLHQSSSSPSTWTPVRAPVFANYWPSITNANRNPQPTVGVATATGSSPRKSSSSSNRSSNFHPKGSLPARLFIGRITHDCIEDGGTTTTTSSSCTTTTTTTNPTTTVSSPKARPQAKAKAKVAVRATVVATISSAVAASIARPLHFFVRGSTRLAANLTVLLHDSTTTARRLFPRSSCPPSLPSVQSLLSPLPSPLLLPIKEALATSTSLAQASLQSRRRRQDPFHNSTVPRRRPRGGLPRTIFPTASHASITSPSPDSASVDASANPRLAKLSQQPAYPGASPELERPLAAAGLPQGRGPPLLRHYDPKDYFLQSPFRNRAATSAARRLPHLSAARLWNPTNSTPRLPEKPIRKRRPSTPPPPSVPLSHPALDPYSVDPADPLGVGAGDYPLLTLPEQRQTRHSPTNRGSLHVDRSGNAEHRISLPRSLRHSYDERRSGDPSPTFPDPEAGPADDKEDILGDLPVESRVEPRVTGLRKRGQSVSNPLVKDFATFTTLDKGKGKAVMEQGTEGPARDPSRDLERGPDVLPRLSNVSAGDGIGSAISSSNSSIMGEELPPDLGEEWGPQHPCFPHLNPHVPTDSPEYQNTRIIRIRRDWLLEGDLAPTFSNLYPEILDPAGLSEQEFRRIIDKLNGELVPIFSPYNWRNIIDGMLGLVTGWLWDDLGFTGVKARLKRLERWIDQWNKEMEKTVGNEDSSMAPRIISLRRTGYMTLDIQIPDPEIAPAPSTPAGSTHMPLEPPAALTA